MTLTFGSLFAGVGGFDMGFEQAGFECKFQVEWDKNCRSVLDRHWPDVEKWGDVCNVNGRFLPPVDVVIFGSPCQDLSVAGKRAGLEGERSGLFHEAVRIIKEMRDATNGTFPRWTVWENVAGALSSNNGRDFGTVVNEMAEAGAVVQEYAVLDAQYFSVPQRRVRVFLVSCFDPATAERCPDPLLPVTESLRGNTAKGKPKRKGAASETSESIGASGQWWDGGDIADAITTTSNEQPMPDKQRLQAIVEGFTSSSFAQYQEGVGTLRSNGGDLGGGSETLIAEPMLSFDTQFGSNANVFEDQSPTLKASQAAPSVAYGIQGNVIGRQPHNGPAGKGHTEEGDPMFTLTKTDIHAVATPMAVRRLTPLECERLMGWPDDHTRFKADGTEQADTHRYKQCGNGVASPVARWVAEHMKQATYEG